MAGAVPPALRLLGAALPRAEAPPLLPVELLADAVGRGDDVALLVLVRRARRQGTGRGWRRPGRGWLVCIILLRLDDRKLQVSSITVEPACKVLGFVQRKLTIQEGFCCLTLQPSIIIKNMVIWDLLELTLHPF